MKNHFEKSKKLRQGPIIQLRFALALLEFLHEQIDNITYGKERSSEERSLESAASSPSAPIMYGETESNKTKGLESKYL